MAEIKLIQVCSECRCEPGYGKEMWITTAYVAGQVEGYYCQCRCHKKETNASS